MRIKNTIVTALLATLVAAGTTTANVLPNGDFESPGANDATPTGWTDDFNTFGQFNGAARNGSFGVHPGASANTGGIYTDLTTEIGKPYDVSLWFQNFASASGLSKMRILVGDAGTDVILVGGGGGGTQSTSSFSTAGLIANEVFTSDASGDWSEATFQFIATSTTTRFGIYNAYTQDLQSSVHSINVDDASVTLVPEPASVVLMTMGGSVLLRRRR